MRGFKTGQKKRPEDDVSLLDPDDWSREIYMVAKDYFSPLAALNSKLCQPCPNGR